MDARGRRAHPHDEAEAQADLREVPVGDRGAVRGLSANASNESLSIGQRAFDRFNEDPNGFWEYIHPEVLLVTDPRWPGGGEFHGIEQYSRFMDSFVEAFEGIQFAEESAPEAIDGFALFHGRWVGLGATSGAETASQPFWVVSRAREGLLGEVRFFFDEAAAREHATSQT